MKDLAPNIVRQRLLVDAKYDRSLSEQDIRDFLIQLASNLGLRTYAEPDVHKTSGGKEENQGYDAFVPLIDSGISLYVWTNEKFLSCFIYTCKKFSSEDAVNFCKDFFNIVEIEHQEF